MPLSANFIYLTDDDNQNFLQDDAGNFYLIVGEIPSSIFIIQNDLIDYIFEFPSKGAAQQDAVLGPYFPPNGPNGLGPDVLMFDRSSILPTIPLLDYWVMISQTAPISNALFNHPNIELVIDRNQLLVGNPNVLLNFPFPDVTRVSIMLSGIGNYASAGLFGVAQGVRPLAVTGYVTEDGSQFYAAEDGTTIYVPES